MNNALYINQKDLPKTVTRKEMIKLFLSGKSYVTYSDSNREVIQCDTGRYRSVTDLHRIVKSEFPLTSLNAIIRIIKELIDEDACVSMVYCQQINKVVLKYYNKATQNYMTKYSVKNFFERKGEDGYSLKDFSEILNNLKK